MQSDTGAIVLPSLYHLSAVVKDIDETAELFSSIWGLGPWQTLEYPARKDEILVGGAPFRLKLAQARLGPTVLELLQPLEGRSIWSEVLETKGEGLHHIAFSISNWEEIVSKLQEHGGCWMVGAGMGFGRRWCYFGTRPGGIIVEFEEQLEGKPVLTFHPDIGAKTLPSPAHIGVVVKDIDKTVEFVSSIWGLGPWHTMDYSPHKDELLVGEAFRLKVAHAKLGPVALELLQPLEGRSIWSEVLETKGEGLHHIAFNVSNWEEMVSKLKEQGSSMVAGGITNGGHWCYFETKPGDIIVEFKDFEEAFEPSRG